MVAERRYRQQSQYSDVLEVTTFEAKAIDANANVNRFCQIFEDEGNLEDSIDAVTRYRAIRSLCSLCLSRCICSDPLHRPPQRPSVVAVNGTMCDRSTTCWLAQPHLDAVPTEFTENEMRSLCTARYLSNG